MRRLANSVRTVFQFVWLTPHGDVLRTTNCWMWILTVRLLMFLTAATEGLSWGYFSFLSAQSAPHLQYLASAICFTIAALVVLAVDSGFLTLDTARSQYEARINDVDPGRAELWKLCSQIGVRIAVFGWVISDTFALQWQGRELACRLVQRTKTPVMHTP